VTQRYGGEAHFSEGGVLRTEPAIRIKKEGKISAIVPMGTETC
jgi:hypothetical protein